MLHSVIQGHFPRTLFGKKFASISFSFPFPWSQKIFFGGSPIQIGFSLLATQLVTPKSAKTTK